MEPICRIKEIYKTLYQFERIFSERHGLTINEAMLLCCLRDDRPRTAGTLCDFVGLSNPRVSKVITAVEGKGFLLRTINPHDRRQMLFSLSDEGYAKIQQMQQAAMGFDELFARLKVLTEEAEPFESNQ